ncbi:hypothetical protein N7519_005432 [Penicillium mononematosum]|uniref:uncharacterized protein n=1 Tax=Penicillium mononematosum TaxID=268346 RepID=UPI0025466783|nr:uncharacterized protein N7519_005432 [Penicillium mononematosum]KAJ6184131.1 hypothetical protein N7519_005432 [Penicillium mononematosum]
MSRAANRACLVAFAAMITHIHRHERAFASADPDAYLQAALTLLPEMLLEPPDLRTLEAVTILPTPPSFVLALLCRRQRILYPKITTTLDKRRRLRSRSAYNIRPGNLRTPLLHEALVIQGASFPSDLRFSLLKSKIFRLLYSAHSQTLPEARRIQYIRELDQELSDLNLGYPADCRPEVFATESAPDYLFHDISMRGVNIHLEYYYCLGKIHGASSSSKIPSPQSWSPLPSSAELCFEAARCSLIYIWRVRQFINQHTFWLHAQFLLTAVLSVFWYLITVPTSSTFTRDLKTLEDIAGLLAHLGRPADDGQTYPPFYLAQAFVERLVSMARHSRSRIEGT